MVILTKWISAGYQSPANIPERFEKGLCFQLLECILSARYGESTVCGA